MILASSSSTVLLQVQLLTSCVAVALLVAQARGNRLFAPATPQVQNKQAEWIAREHGSEVGIQIGSVLLALLCWSFDPVGALCILVAGIGASMPGRAERLWADDHATRDLVRKGGFGGIVMLLALSVEQGELFGAPVRLLAVCSLIGFDLVVQHLTLGWRRAAALNLLFVAVLLALVWALSPLQSSGDEQRRTLWDMRPDPGAEPLTRGQLIAQLVAPGAEMFDWIRLSPLSVELLRLAGGPQPERTNLDAAFRRYMDTYVLKRIEPRVGRGRDGVHEPPTSQGAAEALGLFQAQDYAGVRLQCGRALLFDEATDFHPLLDDLVTYAFLESDGPDELSAVELELIVARAEDWLDPELGVRSSEALVRLDRFFQRVGRPELGDQLEALALDHLQRTWSGLAPTGEGWFSRPGVWSSTEQLGRRDRDGFSFRSATMETGHALILIDRFDLGRHFELRALERSLEVWSSVDDGLWSGSRAMTAAAGLELLRAWPAYAAEVRAADGAPAPVGEPYDEDDVGVVQVPDPPARVDLRLLLTALVSGALFMRLALAAPRADPPLP